MDNSSLCYFVLVVCFALQVVRRVEYVEVGGANKLLYGDAPLPTTLTTYKFPALQKVFSNNRGQELKGSQGGKELTDGSVTPAGATWTGFEFTRTLFARTDQEAPPVVADSEVITQLHVQSGIIGGGDEVIAGHVRQADFLTPNDALYFEARQRAVSISDYEIRLTRPAQEL